ncbi:MAG: ACT domain-containing protein, partial [Rhodobacteraceae bacterium]|nr:ACT domain-containing protein [Paracoccaceae bacterium]
GTRISTFGQPAKSLRRAQTTQSVTPAPFYLRLQLLDKPGALARVAAILAESGISIDRMRQYGHSEETAPVLIVTHKTSRQALNKALAELPNTNVLAAQPVALRIETV